jgi:hypothetical protein
MKAHWLTSVLCIPLTHGLPQLGTTENAITSGQCKDVTFIYARGSTDYGNMVGVQRKHDGLSLGNIAQSHRGPISDRKFVRL